MLPSRTGSRQLFHACSAGTPSLNVEMPPGHMRKVDRRAKEDMSLLWFAGWMGNVQAVDQLLGAGADPWQADRPNQGDYADLFLESMIQSPKDSRHSNHRGPLNHGGDPNALGRHSMAEGHPLLVIAGGTENWGTIKLLLDRGADPWRKGQVPDCERNDSFLEQAAELQEHFVLDYALNKGLMAHATPDQMHALMAALDSY